MKKWIKRKAKAGCLTTKMRFIFPSIAGPALFYFFDVPACHFSIFLMFLAAIFADYLGISMYTQDIYYYTTPNPALRDG